MSRIRASQYIFAVSRIRAIENRLLDWEQLDRMIDAATFKDALKVMTDAGYDYRETEHPASAIYDYEKLLGQEHKKLYGLMEEIAPQPEVFRLFLQPYDFHNIKVMLKAEFAGIEDFAGLLIDRGSIGLTKLEAMMRDRKFNEMPEIMRLAVEEAITDFYHTRDPQTVDLILDRACYARMSQMAASFRHRFLTDLVSGTADLLNINILLRLKWLKKDMEFAGKALLPGGNVPAEVLLKNFGKPAEELIGVLVNTPAGGVAGKELESHRREGMSIEPERMLAVFRMMFIQASRYMISGLEPLVGYLLAKETELRNLRVIMAGKTNRLSGDAIRERLRTVYA